MEWVAISFSNAKKWKVKVKSLSRVQPLATPWTVAYQAPPSMGFSRQEYWEWVAIAFSENTQEQGHIRIWATPTAGLEISTVLVGTLGSEVDCAS